MRKLLVILIVIATGNYAEAQQQVYGDRPLTALNVIWSDTENNFQLIIEQNSIITEVVCVNVIDNKSLTWKYSPTERFVIDIMNEQFIFVKTTYGITAVYFNMTLGNVGICLLNGKLKVLLDQEQQILETEPVSDKYPGLQFDTFKDIIPWRWNPVYDQWAIDDMKRLAKNIG